VKNDYERIFLDREEDEGALLELTSKGNGRRFSSYLGGSSMTSRSSMRRSSTSVWTMTRGVLCGPEAVVSLILALGGGVLDDEKLVR